MIPVIWFAAIVATWWTFAVANRQQLPTHPDSIREVNHVVANGQSVGFGLLLAIPPTILWAVCNFVLLQAAPTAQFNSGSEYAMDLWSFWVDAWAPLFGMSIILFIVYTVSSIAIARSRNKRFLFVSVWALAASVIACFVLRFTYPTA